MAASSSSVNGIFGIRLPGFSPGGLRSQRVSPSACSIRLAQAVATVWG